MCRKIRNIILWKKILIYWWNENFVFFHFFDNFAHCAPPPSLCRQIFSFICKGPSLGTKDQFKVINLKLPSPKAYSKKGLYTIATIDAHNQNAIGQRFRGLSFNDTKIINKAYCKEECSEGSELGCQRRGYADPNDCTRCKCPDGFSGLYCESLVVGKNDQCGPTNLFLDKHSKLVVKSPETLASTTDKESQCVWMITVCFYSFDKYNHCKQVSS